MINPGYSILNDSPLSEEITVAVTGVGRSGTTMVAKILNALDLYLGEKVTPRTFEDKNIQVAIKQKDWNELDSIIEKRNSQHNIWGFKCPALRGSLTQVLSKARNPRLIVTFRDILSISLRNNISMSTDLFSNLEATVEDYQKLVTALKSNEYPVLLISYEKALLEPKQTVSAICKFIGMDISNEDIEKVSKLVVNGDPQYLGLNKEAPSKP